MAENEFRSRHFWDNELGIRDGSAVGAFSRMTGDEALDNLLEQMSGELGDGKALLAKLSGSSPDDTQFAKWNGPIPEPLGFLGSWEPTFSDDARTVFETAHRSSAQAQRFWYENQFGITMSLFFSSLPATYVSENGAAVLAHTGQMSKAASLTRRIPRTGEFVTLVLNDTTLFDANGLPNAASEAYRAIRYVRILHALVRYVLRHDGWDTARRGVPVSQMDLAGTVLAFALVVDEPLRHINGHSDPKGVGENAYLQRWNAIGALLGTEPRYLANDIFSARSLFDSITVEWPVDTASSDSVALAHALREYIERYVAHVPQFLTMVPSLFELLLPQDVARQLAIGTGAHDRTAAPMIGALLAFYAATIGERAVSRRAGKVAVEVALEYSKWEGLGPALLPDEWVTRFGHLADLRSIHDALDGFEHSVPSTIRRLFPTQFGVVDEVQDRLTSLEALLGIGKTPLKATE